MNNPFREQRIEFEKNAEKRRKKQHRIDFFQKSIFTFIVTAIAFMPTIMFFVVKNLLNPEGFWQKFVVFGVGVYFLGGIQIAFIIVWLMVLIQVIWD